MASLWHRGRGYVACYDERRIRGDAPRHGGSR